MGLIEKSMLERWDDAKTEAMHDKDSDSKSQQCCCVSWRSNKSFDVIKILESWQEKIKSENPDYSEKEVSAYLAGMIHGMSLKEGEIDG